MGKINTAIISVTDKTGIVDLVRELVKFNVSIFSTGGTAAKLRDAGVEVTDISAYTGFPEMMDGRIKTLHPKVHGGILGVRDNQQHVEKMKEFGIVSIDMVIINLYAFEKAVAKENCTFEEAIENIDIGGPAMLRSAAKNHKYVTVLTDPSDYERALEEMRSNNGAVSSATNLYLAKKVFKLTHEYDGAIYKYLESLS